MYPISYYTIMRQSKDKRLIRYELIKYAREHGIKPTARAFSTTPKTIRKWMRRWDGSLLSLSGKSHAPRNIPHRISCELEKEIVSFKKKLPTWGARRLKRDFSLPCSEKAILRVYHKYGLVKKRRTIRRKKNDLRKVKAKMRLFERVHCDTKHLYDIPEYLPYIRRLNLPRHQYTFRETVSGLQFISFSNELSGVYAELFIERIQAHLASCGIDLKEVTWQTDNGSEFVGSWNAKTPKGVTSCIESTGSRHKTIPPSAHTWQSDVETVHARIEDELYRIQPFTCRKDFLSKASTYQLFFNAVRPNSSKGDRFPFQIIKERIPDIDPRIVLLPPVFLEDLLKERIVSFREKSLRKHPCRMPSLSEPLKSSGEGEASCPDNKQSIRDSRWHLIKSGGYHLPSYA